MSYAICRIQKCGSSHDIAGVQIHDRRERNHSNTNPDINFERSKNNYSLCSRSDGKTFNATVDEIIAKEYTSSRAIRKDAVKMCEVLFTSDSDFFNNKSDEEQRQFFESCYQWSAERWGESRIVSATVHVDEQTPHMHLCFVPLAETTNKKTGEVVTTLNAHKAIGSGSKAFQKIQDDFYKAVGKTYGLERGSRSDLDGGEQPRKNQRVQEYKNTTQYYQQQKKELQGDVQALQATLTTINDILQAKPQNAIQGIPVPSMAKLALPKEDKDKMLVSTTDINKLQELAAACAVTSSANEVKDRELSIKESELKDRERKIAEKEIKANKLLNNAEETNRKADFKYSQAKESYQLVQKEPYIATLEKKVEELDKSCDKLVEDWREEHQKYEKIRKTLLEVERETAPIKKKNDELSEQIRTLEEEVKQLNSEIENKTAIINSTKEIAERNYKWYNAACDIGERLNSDFNNFVNKRLEGYSVSHILGEDRSRGR